MPLTLPNPSSACRSFCENSHKIPGLSTPLLKPVDNPPILRASLILSSRHAVYILEKIYAAIMNGTSAINMKADPPSAPITSYNFFPLVFNFTPIFFLIAYRLRRIATAQFLYSFYFIFKAHLSTPLTLVNLAHMNTQKVLSCLRAVL